MQSPDALVDPELLIWARTSIHYTIDVAAKRMGLPPDRLAKWEAGHERPTIAQLRRLAEIYKRPLAVFFLPSPPKDFSAMRDFRRITPIRQPEPSPALAYNMRLAWERREFALELNEDDSAAPPIDIKADLTDSPEVVGAHIRSWLGVSIDEQFSWPNDHAAFSAWEMAFERRGILLFQTAKVSSAEVRGFSIGADVLPVVVVNGKDTPLGRIFTMFHELAHILLRDSVICDLSEDANKRADVNEVEIFCNKVAAAALIPTASIERDPAVAQCSSNARWRDTDLARIARKYSVSKEAMLRRLVDLGHASREYYKEKRAEFEAQYASIDHERRSGGPIPQHVLVLKRNGLCFSRMIISALRQGRITSHDVYSHLGLKPKYIDDIDIELLQKRA
ncbi:ImmA/IrrE family metallo-endopeptidase [Sorangium sp. So ce1153]|uniref:ImmA/IrrE family metallo-endopeptidase n=1 Tax=Sorangium sp. So ce1153 TaxID=3133333 RepID=UPI003F63EEAC